MPMGGQIRSARKRKRGEKNNIEKGSEEETGNGEEIELVESQVKA